MESIKINFMSSVDEACNEGYTHKHKYKDHTPLKLKEATVVANGTIEGNPTVDLILQDNNGNMYITITTLNLLKVLFNR